MSALPAKFAPPMPVISKELKPDGDGWTAVCDQARTFRLFETPDPEVEDCTVLYRARLKTEGLTGKAYLEMWCRLPGRGEFFSRGLNQVVTGSTDWISCEIPFLLRKGQAPDLIRLNLVLAASGFVFKKRVAGKVWIAGVELLTTPAR